nr:MAG TPA: hypothetical protein [Caudoviricetes sp.]
MCMAFYLTTSIITVDQRYMPEMIPDYYYRKRGYVMGFTKKTWKNRIAEYINRRLLTNEDGSTELVTVARDEGTISQEGDAFNAANMNDLEDRIEAEFNEVTQSLTNLNDSKKTYLRLLLPNLAADAKAVCDYINKNYLLGQLSPATTVDFDVVASNVDWFSGTLSTDTTTLSPGRTVWGIVQQRTSSAENSTLYKYYGSGTGGVSSVSALDHVKSFIDVSTILKSYTTIAAGATVTYTATRDCFVNVSAYAHGSGQNTKIYINNVHIFNPYTNNGDNAGLMIVDKTVPLKTGQTIKIENGTYTTSSYAIFAAF